MPRCARLSSVSGFYHVSARGTGRINIFEDDEDRYRFLSLLDQKLSVAEIDLVAWCLMSNHFHLMVDDSDGHLSESMKALLISYAKYFNAKTGRVGHLFQNRFSSVPVENDIQAIRLSEYIHLNPAKAGICESTDYRWSSISAYKQGYDRFGICDPSSILDLVGGSSAYSELLAQSEGAYPLTRSSRSFISDDEALAVARDIAEPVRIDEIKSLEKNQRSVVLTEMRQAGLTVNQIERLTGLGRTTISVATSRWRESAA